MLRYVLAVLAGSLLTSTAFGWKPTTHVALAQIALADALDDGKVSIYKLDPLTGNVLSKVGDYPVDPILLEAIRNNQSQFFAGVLGPDAYPDMLTGQQAIHPGDDPRDGDAAGVANEPGEGTDAWLNHLWTASRSSSARIKAWVAGYFTHAAGDMYAHTLMNYYAGGRFAVGSNAARHILLEGYIGLRGPQPTYQASIAGVDNFIYQNLVRMEPNSTLSTLLVGPGATTSIPYQFSTLRNKLQRHVNAYDQKTTAQRAAYDATHPFEILYVREWIEDIDDGLRAWPAFSHSIAMALFFNPDGVDVAEAGDLANNYVNTHLLSMMGLPEFVGQVRGLTQALADAFVPEDLKEKFREYKQGLVDAMFHLAGLPSPTDVKKYVENPQTHFNAIMGPESIHNDQAHTITLLNFNRNVLNIQDSGYTNPSEKWTVDTFPPAYNTVLLTKMLLMKKETINQLISDIKNPRTTTKTVTSPFPTVTSPTITTTPTLPSIPTFSLNLGTLVADNVMLGWQNNLDDDNQWHVNTGKMVFVAAGVYDQLFKPQVGIDDNPTVAPPKKTIKVKIRRVKQVDDLDYDLIGGGADFYAVITIDSDTNRTSTKLDDDDVVPNWEEAVATAKPVMTIRIELYDSDGGLRGADEHCDINRRSGKSDLVLTYNTETGAISGDATGTRGNEIHVTGAGDPDRAEMYFTIDHS